MQPQDQRIQRRIVARGCGDLVDLSETSVRDSATGARKASRLGHLEGRGVRLPNQPVIDGVLVSAAQGRDEMFSGAASASCVSAGHDVGPEVFAELLNL